MRHVLDTLFADEEGVYAQRIRDQPHLYQYVRTRPWLPLPLVLPPLPLQLQLLPSPLALLPPLVLPPLLLPPLSLPLLRLLAGWQCLVVGAGLQACGCLHSHCIS